MIQQERSGIIYFEFESLNGDGRIRHAIFARHGGVSQPPHDSLNLSVSAEDPASASALGGVLMARVQADPAFASRASELAGTPVMTFLKAVDPGKSLAVAYAELAQAMVDRHEQVSRNKNRQRWCYLDGDAVVRDDLRPIGYGWHAMRFPQLSSLCRDLGLKREEVSGGR